MARTARRFRLLPALGACIASALAAGCDSLLDVTNPAAITEESIGGQVDFMVNGVENEFRREYAWLAAHGAMFTDEAIQGHPWSPWNVYDARAITPDSPAYDGLSYQLLQAARGTADVMIPKIEAVLGEAGASSASLARAYAYAGYSYIMLADYMCEAPIDRSAAHPQSALYEMAAERLETAIDIATAARAGGDARADFVLALARVGAARVYLNLDRDADAIAAASQVPASFVARVHYAQDASDWRVYNFYHWFAGYRFPGELDMALEPARFGTLADARMPIERDTTRRLGDGLRDGILPFQPSSFSEWSPEGRLFGEATAIRFASGLEARYILAEAGGMSAVELRAFVNERRSAGGDDTAFPGTDAELAAELREQRFRDFFLDGHRMGDLRRYKRSGIDLWPTGPMPGLSQSYGTQECWPIAASEVASNPNLGG